MNIELEPSTFEQELCELVSKHFKLSGVDMSPDEIELDIPPARNGEIRIIIQGPKL